MSMFNELDSSVFVTELPLKLKGKTYLVKEVDWELGLWCQRLLQSGYMIMGGATAEQLGEMPPFPLGDGTFIEVRNNQISNDGVFYQRLLGPVWQELKDDGAGFETLKLFAITTFMWCASGLEMAQDYWNAGGNPESIAPNRQARRSANATAGANTTKQPGSGSTTRRSRRTRSGR